MAEQLMRAQLKGSTASINSTAGYKGVLVLNTDTNHLHVLTGEAGNNIELANKTDIPENVDISGKADISYVNTQLNTKLGKTEKAESAKVADSATKATKDASGNVITATYATKSEVTSGLAGKQPKGDYATTEALTEGLATKLGATAKAVSAGTADTATKATRDASGNVITTTYATKTEVTSGLSGKLGKTEKASSANTADAVAWAGVTGKPSFATVATTGSYNDLTDKPSVSSGTLTKIFDTINTIRGSGTITITGITPNKLLYVAISNQNSYRMIAGTFKTGVVLPSSTPTFRDTSASIINCDMRDHIYRNSSGYYYRYKNSYAVVLPSGTSVSLVISAYTAKTDEGGESPDKYDVALHVIAYQ